MEKIIIAVILGVIATLIYLRAKVKNNPTSNKKEYDPLPGIPDIMGRPKLGERPKLPTQVTETENDSSASVMYNFETVNKRENKIAIPQEEPDEENIPDWEEEEEDMKGYAANAVFSINDGLATGVTYDELAAMGKMLEYNVLQPSEKEATVSLASKIDGTELMLMLETAVGDASKKIAKLLERADYLESDSGSSSMRNGNDGSFNIGNYV